MKNKVVRFFSMFLVTWLVLTMILNYFHHRALLVNFPWEVILMFLLALIMVTTNLGKRAIYGIYFVVFLAYMMTTANFYNWSSLIIFALMAIMLSLVTYYIGIQFRKGESSKPKK